MKKLKKIFSVFAFAALCIIPHSVIAETLIPVNNLEFDSVIFTNSENDEIYAIDDETSINADMHFTAPQDGDGNIILAKYNNAGKLTSATITPVKMTTGNIVPYNVSGIDVSGIETVKIFVWDLTMKPLLEQPAILHKTGSAENKFTVNENVPVYAGVAVTLGDLFSENADLVNAVDSKTVRINLTDVNDTGITAEYTPDTDNWKNSTLVLTGIGDVQITIRDYKYCIPATTTITVNAVEKFTATSNTDFNAEDIITLGELFTATGYAINDENVAITVNSTENYEYIQNKDNWVESTIVFKCTGEFTVTITDNLYCIASETTVKVNAINKFTAKTDLSVNAETAVALGELFDANEFAIDSSLVTISESDKYSYVPNESNWTQGTVTFNSIGEFTVTISENDCCVPAETTVTVNPIEKFTATENKTFNAETEIKLGDLFTAVEGVNIDNTKVTAKIGENEIEVNSENWASTSITFDSVGNFTITIAENDCCNIAETTVTVNKINKFTAKTGISVDAETAVALGELFDANEFAIDSSLVTISESDKYSYVPNESNWTQGTVTFNSIGEFTVTISENDCCVPAETTVTVNPIEKFTATENKTFNAETEIKLGDLFTAVEGVNIDNTKVVAKMNGNEFDVNDDNWTETTISLTTAGTITFTIVENENCIEASNTITVNMIDKFAVVFENADNMLYRVGNENSVKLSSLFSSDNAVDNSIVNVDVVNVKGNANGTFTANTTDWTQGSIKFTGTGVVTLTIKENAYVNPVKLSLEVVKATNVTSYDELYSNKAKSTVLLNNITMTDGSKIPFSGVTLYGNGFEFDVTKGAYAGSGTTGGNYLVSLTNATIDNVIITGSVYTSFSDTASGDYNFPVIAAYGTSAIKNSRISNCASPVRVFNGNLEIIDSTLRGGSYANLDIRGGNITLENVTTINQFEDNDTTSDGNKIIGLGIVIWHEGVSNSTTLNIKGDFTQYNYIQKSDKDYSINTATSNAAFSIMFGTECNDHIYTDAEDTKWINTGIFSLSASFGKNNILTDIAGYKGTEIDVNDGGYLYSLTSTPPVKEISYLPSEQAPIAPAYSFDYKTKNYIAKTEDSNDYCYYDNGKVLISFDEGDTFNWDTSILTVTKGTDTLNYTVSMNGTDYTGKSIPFTSAGVYTVTYTYTDSNNYSISDGAIGIYDKTYTKNVNILTSAVKPSAKNAKFNFVTSDTTAFKTVTIGNDTYVMPDVSATSDTIGSKTVSGTTIYCPIVEGYTSNGKTSQTSGTKWYMLFPVFKNVVTITDYADGGTGDPVTYDSSTTTLPSGLAAVNPNTTFQYSSSPQAPETPSVFSKVLCYTSPEMEGVARSASTVYAKYCYKDNAGATYYYYVRYDTPKITNTTCVTPDTLITLSDGTQKEVQYLTGEEELLVWDHATGTFKSSPIAYIVDHDDEENESEIIHLYFEDGKTVDIIGEHVFFNSDLNRYVTLDANSADYIGNSFAVMTDGELTNSKLAGVEKEYKKTAVYEVVTYENLTCFTNNVLSASAYIDKLLNIFDINPDTMAYYPEKVAEDIEKYGLYTYEDFADLVPEKAFDMYNAKYLKIAVGKGYITWNDILALISIYSDLGIIPLS